MRLRLQLRQPDFTTAQRVAVTVNKQFGSQEAPVAHADNGGTITVNIPPGYASRPTDFIADMERLSVEADRTARVVVNERTGTIVMGKEVRISPVAILHGNLSVEIQTNYVVSQPAPLSQGTTTVVPQVGIGVQEEKARNLILKQGATIEELVRGLNAIGSTPRDIVAILQALREAGALEAELEVM